jgi:hypothetical protein
MPRAAHLGGGSGEGVADPTEGTPFSTVEAGRVWVQLRQVADGHWGGFGELVRMPDIAAYGLGVGPEDGKGLRIRAAFDAARSAEPVSA